MKEHLASSAVFKDPAGIPPQGYPQQYPPQMYPQQYPPEMNQVYPNQGAPGIGFIPGAPIGPLAPGQYPAVSPIPAYAHPVEWIPSNPNSAESLANKAVVAGYEGHDGSPIWVIRSHFEGDVIPGKLSIKHKSASVPWGGRENRLDQFDVCCIPPYRVRWVEGRNGSTAPNAIPGGCTSSGETIFIGRANQQNSLIPGKIHPSHKVMYMPFGGDEIPHSVYQVLCLV